MARRRENDIASTVTETVRRYIRAHEMLLGGESILLAVSGGVDSMAMLELLSRIGGPLGSNIGVAHFDHGLRPKGGEDADFVREVARRIRLKVFVGAADIRKIVEEGGGSVEEVARRERYAFLERIARRHNYDVVMTGHTADDNAETLLMNLIRGTGVTGLAGIPATRRLGGNIILARPLLGLSRADVEAFAGDIRLEWREDETNASNEFTRNRVRQELMPVLKKFNPSILDVLNTTAGLMRDVDRYLSGVVDSSIEATMNGETKPGERAAVNAVRLRHLHPAVRGEVVQRIISDTFSIPPVSSRTIERVLDLMWKDTGARASLGGRHEALRDRENIVFYRRPIVIRDIDREFVPGEEIEAGEMLLSTSFIEGKPDFTSDSAVEFINAENISGRLVIRSWREGDAFQPIGMKGQEKKLSDFLIDRKVPLDRKGEVLVIADGDAIIWVCGMRLDERYRVEKDTGRILRMEYRPL